MLPEVERVRPRCRVDLFDSPPEGNGRDLPHRRPVHLERALDPEQELVDASATVDIEDNDEGKTKRRRRRGRRGGRRRRRNEDSEAIASEENSDEKSADAIASDTEDNIAPEAETGDEAAPPEMDALDTENTANDITASDENTDTVVEIASAETVNEAVNETVNEVSDDAEVGSARKGWWRRS